MSNAIASQVAEAYARVAAQCCAEKNKDWGEVLGLFSRLLTQKMTAVALTKPSLHDGVIYKALWSVVPEAHVDDQDLSRWLTQLISHNRWMLMPQILSGYQKFYAQICDRHMISLTLASSSLKLKATENKACQVLGLPRQAHCVFDVTIDSTLLGGMIIRYGDRVWDFSVRKQLQTMVNQAGI